MEEREQFGASTDESTRVSQRHLGESGTRSVAWRPLRVPSFRNLLIADLVSDIGTFMQGVGAAWLIVSEGAGPLLVALTQTASAPPFFLLALPAGALGDIFDRRKLVTATEVWMPSVATVIAASAASPARSTFKWKGRRRLPRIPGAIRGWPYRRAPRSIEKISG